MLPVLHPAPMLDVRLGDIAPVADGVHDLVVTEEVDHAAADGGCLPTEPVPQLIDLAGERAAVDAIGVG